MGLGMRLHYHLYSKLYNIIIIIILIILLKLQLCVRVCMCVCESERSLEAIRLWLKPFVFSAKLQLDTTSGKPLALPAKVLTIG